MTDAQKDVVTSELRRLATEGRIPCKAALELSGRLGVSPSVVGEAANLAGVKICACQLGCFK